MNFLTRMANDVQLMLRRPARLQFAALCYRRSKNGNLEFLVITSRDTGRWVIPKGWPMEGRKAHQVAEREAYEEAGVVGKAEIAELGHYSYQKKLDNGMNAECRVQVHAVAVEKLVDVFPEVDQRRREWVTADVAAERVAEVELKEIIRNFAAKFA